jgi:hypothetical protein
MRAEAVRFNTRSPHARSALRAASLAAHIHHPTVFEPRHAIGFYVILITALMSAVAILPSTHD